MKKIMFNDLYGLTRAVLEGRKTQTRRICKEQCWAYSDIINAENGVFHFEKPKYDIGEIVAIAQSYKDCGYSENALDISPRDYRIARGTLGASKGWNNKMFVRPDACKYRICITNIRIERLQDISDEDCLAEGIVVNEPKVRGGVKSYYPCQCLKECVDKIGWGRVYATPREAYADLIDKVSGNGTWEINPWVWAYDFELVN